MGYQYWWKIISVQNNFTTKLFQYRTISEFHFSTKIILVRNHFSTKIISVQMEFRESDPHLFQRLKNVQVTFISKESGVRNSTILLAAFLSLMNVLAIVVTASFIIDKNLLILPSNPPAMKVFMEHFYSLSWLEMKMMMMMIVIILIIIIITIIMLIIRSFH